MFLNETGQGEEVVGGRRRLKESEKVEALVKWTHKNRTLSQVIVVISTESTISSTSFRLLLPFIFVKQQVDRERERNGSTR